MSEGRDGGGVMRSDDAPVTWAEFRKGAERLLDFAYSIDRYGMERSEDNYAKVLETSRAVNAFFGPIVEAED